MNESRVWLKEKSEFIHDLDMLNKLIDGELINANDYVIDYFTEILDDKEVPIYNRDLVSYYDLSTWVHKTRPNIGVIMYDRIKEKYVVKDFDTKLEHEFSNILSIEVIGHNHT